MSRRSQPCALDGLVTTYGRRRWTAFVCGSRGEGRGALIVSSLPQWCLISHNKRFRPSPEGGGEDDAAGPAILRRKVTAIGASLFSPLSRFLYIYYGNTFAPKADSRRPALWRGRRQSPPAGLTFFCFFFFFLLAAVCACQKYASELAGR